ncbi:unnamed protein product [Mytilus coruscus]|uniref:Uncharacterized protein n=1 Tax=Mytilus coruscus TaxID=42192 RepID=A0A6J8CX68_MYTCO|nr:unnamed protein product [Mytilus coruscus]
MGLNKGADKQNLLTYHSHKKFPNFKPTPRGPLLSAFIKNDNNETPGFTVQQPHLNVKATPFTPLKLKMEDKTVNNSAFADFLTREDVDKGTSSQHIIPDFPLENTDTDKEIRPLVSVSKTNVNDITKLGSNCFERFSSWMALVRAIARLKHFLSSVYSGTFHNWHSCVDCKSVHSFEEAQKFIIRVVQCEVYDSELSCLKENSTSLIWTTSVICIIVINYASFGLGNRNATVQQPTYFEPTKTYHKLLPEHTYLINSRTH